jgi:hypothetical protein
VIEAKDRPLFEALIVAIAGGMCADPGVICEKIGWVEVTEAAWKGLLAVRAAEGPEEAKPVTPGDLDLIWLEGECKSLRERLDASIVSAGVRAHEAYRNGFADGARLTTRDWTELVDQSEAIIHALCNDRAHLRQWVREVTEVGCDDPDGATGEDELTDVERRVLGMLPATWEELAARIDERALDLAVDAMWQIGAICRLTEHGFMRYHASQHFAQRQPVRILPVGHVPGPGGLRVGMVLDFYGRSRLKVASIAGEVVNFEGDIFANCKAAWDLPLAAPYTLTGDP